MSEAKNTVLASRARFGYYRRVTTTNIKTTATNLPSAVTQYFAANSTVYDENRAGGGHDALEPVR